MPNSSIRMIKFSRRMIKFSRRMTEFSNKAQNSKRGLFNSTGNREKYSH